MKKIIPTFGTDKEAQEFVATADLADYDLSGGRPVQFKVGADPAHNRMRVPALLAAALKARASWAASATRIWRLIARRLLGR
jgi:hypothetical protein